MLGDTYSENGNVVYLFPDGDGRAARINSIPESGKSMSKLTAVKNSWRLNRPALSINETHDLNKMNDIVSTVSSPSYGYDEILNRLGLSFIECKNASIESFRKLKTGIKAPIGAKKVYGSRTSKIVPLPTANVVDTVVPKEEVKIENPVATFNSLNDTRTARLERTGRISVINTPERFNELAQEAALENDFYGINAPAQEEKKVEETVNEDNASRFKLGEGERVLDRVIEVNHGSTAEGNIADGTRNVTGNDIVSKTAALKKEIISINQENADLDRQIMEIGRQQAQLKANIARKQEENNQKRKLAYEKAQKELEEANGAKLEKTASLIDMVKEVERLRQLEATMDRDSIDDEINPMDDYERRMTA